MKKQLPKKKAKSEINSVILDGPPPIQRIIKDIESVSAQTIAIYAYLCESAYWSQSLDRVDRAILVGQARHRWNNTLEYRRHSETTAHRTYNSGEGN